MANISLWNPAEEFGDMRRLMSRLMGSAFDQPLFPVERAIGTMRFHPAVEIEDLGTEFLVRCELPGMTENDVQVTVTGNTLTVRGEKRYERVSPKEESGGGKQAKKQPGEAKGAQVSGQGNGGQEGEMSRPQQPIFSERAYGMFERVITLPDDVDATKVDATFQNGVLEIRLPRREESKPRQIPVKIH